MDNVGIFSKMDIITNQYDENHRPYIKNLIVENADILGGSNVGILIGYLNYYYRNNSHNFMTYLDNIYVSGKLQGTKYLGSIIGGMYFEHNNYNNTFAKNIQISTKLTPTTNDSFNASFIGYITNKVNKIEADSKACLEEVKDLHREMYHWFDTMGGETRHTRKIVEEIDKRV